MDRISWTGRRTAKPRAVADQAVVDGVSKTQRRRGPGTRTGEERGTPGRSHDDIGRRRRPNIVATIIDVDIVSGNGTRSLDTVSAGPGRALTDEPNMLGGQVHRLDLPARALPGRRMRVSSVGPPGSMVASRSGQPADNQLLRPSAWAPQITDLLVRRTGRSTSARSRCRPGRQCRRHGVPWRRTGACTASELGRRSLLVAELKGFRHCRLRRPTVPRQRAPMVGPRPGSRVLLS